MTKVELALPDALAQEASQAGLLTSDRLEQWIRQELRTRSHNSFFEAMERASAAVPDPLTPEEVAEEIAQMRAERRSMRS